jgi:hypothetical protein
MRRTHEIQTETFGGGSAWTTAWVSCRALDMVVYHVKWNGSDAAHGTLSIQLTTQDVEDTAQTVELTGLDGYGSYPDVDTAADESGWAVIPVRNAWGRIRLKFTQIGDVGDAGDEDQFTVYALAVLRG